MPTHMPSAVYDALFDADVIAQVSSVTEDAQIKEWIGRFSAGLDPQEIGVMSTDPKFTLETSDILGALTAADIVGGGPYGQTSIKFPLIKRAEAGAFAGTVDHAVITATGGLLVITELSAQQDDTNGAKCSLDFYPTWDGTNPIIGYSTSQTLDAQTFEAMFTLGPIEPNSGAALQFVTGVTVRPGITVECKRYGGSAFPTVCYIKMREPEIEVEFEDMDGLQANFFASLTALVVYFQQLVDGDARDDGTSTEHIKFTLTGGLQITRSVSASGNDNAKATVLFKGKTLAVATGVAIT